jgi:predicted dehydrogenase
VRHFNLKYLAAEEIIAMAKEYNVKEQVGHVERFNPAFMPPKT